MSLGGGTSGKISSRKWSTTKRWKTSYLSFTTFISKPMQTTQKAMTSWWLTQSRKETSPVDSRILATRTAEQWQPYQTGNTTSACILLRTSNTEKNWPLIIVVWQSQRMNTKIQSASAGWRNVEGIIFSLPTVKFITRWLISTTAFILEVLLFLSLQKNQLKKNLQSISNSALNIISRGEWLEMLQFGLSNG